MELQLTDAAKTGPLVTGETCLREESLLIVQSVWPAEHCKRFREE